MENRPLTGKGPDEDETLAEDEEIICHESLGGILRHYERVAAGAGLSYLMPRPSTSCPAILDARINKDGSNWSTEGNHQFPR
jgi:hypothetical protein